MDERQAGNQQTKQIKNAYLFIKALLQVNDLVFHSYVQLLIMFHRARFDLKKKKAFVTKFLSLNTKK